MSNKSSGNGSAASEALIREIATRHASLPGPLLLILHAIQDELGFVPNDAVPVVAEVLNVSRAEVHGVISFYHLLRDTPGATPFISAGPKRARPWVLGPWSVTPRRSSALTTMRLRRMGALALNQFSVSEIALVPRPS